MSKEKQIEEMAITLSESQHAFDRAWKECLHNNAPMPDRENVFYAKYLVEKEGYRKASEVAREIFEEIEEGVKTAISALAFENNPIHRQVKHESYLSLMRFVKTVEKKYIGEDTNVRTNTEGE